MMRMSKFILCLIVLFAVASALVPFKHPSSTLRLSATKKAPVETKKAPAKKAPAKKAESNVNIFIDIVYTFHIRFTVHYSSF